MIPPQPRTAGGISSRGARQAGAPLLAQNLGLKLQSPPRYIAEVIRAEYSAPDLRGSTGRAIIGARKRPVCIRLIHMVCDRRRV